MREVDAVNVVTQTFFCFSKLNITGANFSDGKLLANSSILIFLSSRDFSLTITFRFFAIFPKYFNSLSSSFFRNIVFLKIIKTVFMPGQKKGKKFMVSKRKNEGKEKI